MSRVSKLLKKGESKAKIVEKKPKYINTTTMVTPNVILILPDGTKREVSAEEYKKRGTEIWAEINSKFKESSI